MSSLRQHLYRRRKRFKEPGYALPLAIGVSGLLLLGSLSLHGFGMQERLVGGAMERQQRDEDLLASAAHKLLSVLNSSHVCLLKETLVDWETKGADCAADGATAVGLKTVLVMDTAVELLAWQPTAQPLIMEMALQLASGRQARYEVRLAKAIPGVAQLGHRILGGVEP